MYSTLTPKFLQVDPQTRFNAFPANSSLLSASSSNLSSSINNLTIALPSGGFSSARKRFLSSFKSALSTSMQHLAAFAPGGSSASTSSKNSTRSPVGPQPPSSIPATPSSLPTHQMAGARASIAPSPLSFRAADSHATVCPPDAPGPLTAPQLYNRRSPSPQLATRMSISPASASSRGDVALSPGYELAGRFTHRALGDASVDEMLAQINATKPSGSTQLGRLKLPGWGSTASSSASSFSQQQQQQQQSSHVLGRCSSSSDEDESEGDGRAISGTTGSRRDMLSSDLLHAADGMISPPPASRPRLPPREVDACCHFYLLI